jgi:hypothetical protein
MGLIGLTNKQLNCSRGVKHMNALFFKAMIMFGLLFGMAGEGHVQPTDGPMAFAYKTTAQRMLGVVDEVQARLQAQAKTMTQAKGELNEPAEDAFAYMNGHLNRVRQELEDGLSDPLAFRARVNMNRPEEAPVQPEMIPGDGNDECEEGCEPAGYTYRYGQEEENDGQHGPGPNECEEDCEPAGDENHYGQEDENDGQNGPGGKE